MAMTPEPLKAGRASNISAVQVSAHVLRETGEVVEAAGVAVELFEIENDVLVLEEVALVMFTRWSIADALRPRPPYPLEQTGRLSRLSIDRLIVHQAPSINADPASRLARGRTMMP
jgi:hypothetical protein